MEKDIDRGLHLIVFRDNAIFDNVVVKSQCVLRYDRLGINDKRETSTRSNGGTHMERVPTKPVRLCTGGLLSYLVSAYVVTLSNSSVYRNAALTALFEWLHDKSLDGEHVLIIFVRLRTPRRQFLDYKWNERLMSLILERHEADHAMSWLSTLGGAFSALGEEFQHCAEMAGKISVRQFELALHLGDPLLVARCKLYAALSLIQRGYFRTPRFMIKGIYKFALEEKDVRLCNMCQGIWAKLQYCYKQYKQRRKLASSNI